MINTKSPEYRKLAKLCNNYATPMCPVCNEHIRRSDIDKAEYIKTKRGTEIFIHTKCVYKYWKQQRRSAMIKTTEEICKTCKYYKRFSPTDFFCDYLCMTKKRRTCEVGKCDKYQSKGAN